MSAQRWVARSNREVWTSDGGTSETRVAVVEGGVTMERAHLIAAAPELLAALRDALDWNANDLRTMDEITPDEAMLKARRKVLRAAIAKAEGR